MSIFKYIKAVTITQKNSTYFMDHLAKENELRMPNIILLYNLSVTPIIVCNNVSEWWETIPSLLGFD